MKIMKIKYVLPIVFGFVVSAQAETPCQIGDCGTIGVPKELAGMKHHRRDISKILHERDPEDMTITHNWSTSRKETKLNGNGIKKIKARDVDLMNNKGTRPIMLHPVKMKK